MSVRLATASVKAYSALKTSWVRFTASVGLKKVKISRLLKINEPPREKTNNLHTGENKDADQLRGNREADQRLCFRYSDSTIPLVLTESKISSF